MVDADAAGVADRSAQGIDKPAKAGATKRIGRETGNPPVLTGGPEWVRLQL